MSFILSSGLTVEQVIEGLRELATLGLDVLEQAELVPLVDAAAKLAEDGAALIRTGPTDAEVLRSEVDAEQAGVDAAEDAKIGGKG